MADKSTAANTTTAKSSTTLTTDSTAVVDKKCDLGLLEEDDEFEEFPAEVWNDKQDVDEELNLWEDNWDDDNVEEDFSKQLKSELEKKPFA